MPIATPACPSIRYSLSRFCAPIFDAGDVADPQHNQPSVFALSTMFADWVVCSPALCLAVKLELFDRR